MDANTLNTLTQQEAEGSITEDNFVELMRALGEEDDEEMARHIYRTSYAARFAPTTGATYLV